LDFYLALDFYWRAPRFTPAVAAVVVAVAEAGVAAVVVAAAAA